MRAAARSALSIARARDSWVSSRSIARPSRNKTDQPMFPAYVVDRGGDHFGGKANSPRFRAASSSQVFPGCGLPRRPAPQPAMVTAEQPFRGKKRSGPSSRLAVGCAMAHDAVPPGAFAPGPARGRGSLVPPGAPHVPALSPGPRLRIARRAPPAAFLGSGRPGMTSGKTLPAIPGGRGRPPTARPPRWGNRPATAVPGEFASEAGGHP